MSNSGNSRVKLFQVHCFLIVFSFSFCFLFGGGGFIFYYLNGSDEDCNAKKRTWKRWNAIYNRLPHRREGHLLKKQGYVTLCMDWNAYKTVSVAELMSYRYLVFPLSTKKSYKKKTHTHTSYPVGRNEREHEVKNEMKKSSRGISHCWTIELNAIKNDRGTAQDIFQVLFVSVLAQETRRNSLHFCAPEMVLAFRKDTFLKKIDAFIFSSIH